MKKFLIIFMIILLLIVTGCGSSKEKTIKPIDFKAMVGEYEIDSVKVKKKTYKKNVLKEVGRNAKLKVNGDKTMILSYNKKDYKFTYNSKYIISKSKEKNIKNKYTFKDDTLIIDTSGIGKMIFKKIKK